MTGLKETFPKAMTINTDYLRRCLDTLEAAFKPLERGEAEGIAYEICRAACVKEFELVLEQSGKLLKKRLRPWFASNRQADRLIFKDAFRHAAKHGLIPTDAAERWHGTGTTATTPCTTTAKTLRKPPCGSCRTSSPTPRR